MAQDNHQIVPLNERIYILDILRGFAVFGILAVNIMAFSMPNHDFSQMILNQETADWYDQLALGFNKYFTEGKFFIIFSFLFGLGFSVQLTRAGAKGNNILSFYPRRLLILLGFGILHSLFWWGDVLRIYAILGFVLLAFRKWSNQWLLTLAVLCIFSSGIVAGFPNLFGDGIGSPSDGILKSIFFGLKHMGTSIMGVFFLGRIVGRLRVFEKLPQYKGLFLKVIIFGLIVSAGLRVIAFIFTTEPGGTETLLKGFSDMALSAVYVCTLSILSLRPNIGKYLNSLGYIGRMALTNYMVQTIICVSFFRIFDLEGKVNAAWLLLMTFLIYRLQLLYSRWWLTRFKYGPLEWLWRSLTFGEMQSFRLK
ncbi:MAG: DUF418 domain-containing protein [Cytophagaceae bacterium]|nr:DUF418 domain-containing protein [Cytophagaceae bacterium]MBL0303025.1 DUF418 domain-containing protein [Cytophagaceae bacterium]